MKTTISFHLRNDLTELERLRRELENFFHGQSLSKKNLLAINLSLEEHFTNIVTHGYCDQEEHWIEITLSLEERKFMVYITDDGIAYDPTGTAPPPLDEPPEKRRIGGLGVHLTKHFMDHMAYRRSGNRNVLEMTKIL